MSKSDNQKPAVIEMRASNTPKSHNFTDEFILGEINKMHPDGAPWRIAGKAIRPDSIIRTYKPAEQAVISACHTL